MTSTMMAAGLINDVEEFVQKWNNNFSTGDGQIQLVVFIALLCLVIFYHAWNSKINKDVNLEVSNNIEEFKQKYQELLKNSNLKEEQILELQKEIEKLNTSHVFDDLVKEIKENNENQ